MMYWELVVGLLVVVHCVHASTTKCGGVEYGGKCYQLAYTDGSGGSFEDGRSWCQFFGGELAEIDSEHMYDVVYHYVLNNWVPRKNLFVNVLLGSTYNPSTNMIHLSNGNSWQPRSNLWHETWPHTDAHETAIGFQVNTGPGRPKRGFFNHNGSGQYGPVPLCVYT